MHRLIIILALFSSNLLLVAKPARAVDTYQGVIAVVVNKKQSFQSLKLNTTNLKTVFWRKQRYWPKGLPIKPVNLDSKHPIRLSFSQSVLGSNPSAQIDYWNGQYFNGINPPYSVSSEEAVIRYVSKTLGAIGYVDMCHLDDRVKPLLWIVNGRTNTSPPKQFSCKQ